MFRIRDLTKKKDIIHFVYLISLFQKNFIEFFKTSVSEVSDDTFYHTKVYRSIFNAKWNKWNKK